MIDPPQAPAFLELLFSTGFRDRDAVQVGGPMCPSRPFFCFGKGYLERKRKTRPSEGGAKERNWNKKEEEEAKSA
jgi:hypothetical protein